MLIEENRASYFFLWNGCKHFSIHLFVPKLAKVGDLGALMVLRRTR